MIQSILKHPEWEEVVEMLKEEFLEVNKPINFKTDGKTNEQIASEVKGCEYSARAVKKFLNRMDRLKNPIEGKKKIYK